ncbi:MAG: hypothetical protein EBR82_50845 [Caulobacteraceae bacterium]|nr:hypothetical protein [Caulobacteraceae bacterium]
MDNLSGDEIDDLVDLVLDLEGTAYGGSLRDRSLAPKWQQRLAGRTEVCDILIGGDDKSLWLTPTGELVWRMLRRRGRVLIRRESDDEPQ